MSYCIIDKETTIRSSFKRKANPFDTANWVVAMGYQFFSGAVQFWYSNQRDDAGYRDAFLKLLRQPGLKTLVGFNIKFDLTYALRDMQIHREFRHWVAQGGAVWDCQLAEYLLDAMHPASHMLPLDDVALRYGGDVKESEVKDLWEAGVSTEDIPKELLLRYLCGEPENPANGITQHLGDIDNTKLIFLGQAARAKRQGQMASLKLNMDALLFTIEAELRGMYCDKALGLKLADELRVEVNKKHTELMGLLPSNLPFDFNINSRQQLSAWIFGGSVRYPSKAYTFEGSDPVFVDLYNPEVHPPIRYVQKEVVEETGEFFKSGKNAGQPKTRKVKVDDLDKPKTRMEDRYYTFPGLTQPDPKWLGDSGVYSTSEEVLSIIVNRDVPQLKVLGEYFAMNKDLGTYFISTSEDGKQKGMLTLVDPDTNLIHHKLNMCSTVTARLSSSDPNLQNLPKGKKSKVKHVFVSRFGPAGKIIQSDFSSLEVYVQAILTRCKLLIEDLKAGIDMHCMRLSVKEKMPYDEVYKLCKVDEVPEWDYKRTLAKVFSFQRAYGAGKKKIAESTGMAEEDVQALIDAENERYPEVEAYYTDEVMPAIEATATDVGNYQAHPDFPKRTINLRVGYFKTPDGKRYHFLEQPAPRYLVERQGTFTSFSPTEVKNYPVQGMGAEFAKAAMKLCVRLWFHLNNFDDRAYLINQVHDAVYVDAHEDVADEAAAALHACMELASAVIEKMVGSPLPIWVPSDTMYGPSMAVEGHINDPEKFKANVARYRELITKLNLI